MCLNFCMEFEKFHTTVGGLGGLQAIPPRGNSGVMRLIGALRNAIGGEAPLDKLRGAKRRVNLFLDTISGDTAQKEVFYDKRERKSF